MITTWIIDYKQKFGKTSVPTTTAIEGPNSREEAKTGFLRKNPEVNPKSVKVTAGALHCESYEELVEWLKSREVSPREAQSAVQVMVLNPRMPREPWPCPGCGIDLNKVDIDKTGNCYYCPKCHELIQTG
jgi:hypothetical protein